MLTTSGILKYDKGSKEIEKYSKINYLSDGSPSYLKYDPETEYLVIGYSNGNVDLMKGNEITNFNDIKNKSLNGSKSINCIIIIDGLAYLGCDFGVVVVNLDRQEVKETWLIGENGSYLKINDMIYDDEYIYLATTKGIYKGNRNENLVDFSKWEIITNNYTPEFAWLKGQNFNTFCFFQGKIIANYKGLEPNTDTVVAYSNGTWEKVLTEVKSVNSLSNSPDTLICCTNNVLYTFNKEFQKMGEFWKYYSGYGTYTTYAVNAQIDGNRIWVADNENGLAFIEDWWGDRIPISGPSSNNVFDLVASRNKVVAAKGSYNVSYVSNWYKAAFYEYRSFQWNSYDKNTNEELNGIYDIVRITIDPNDESHYFLSSWSDGLFEYRDNKFYKHYDASNSTLQTIDGTDYVRTGPAAFDSEGNLWVTTSLTTRTLHVLKKDGTWKGFTFPGISKNVCRLIITQTGKKWILFGQIGGMLVFDDKGTIDDTSDDQYRALSVYDEDGEIVSNDVYSIAEDKNGYIWVGTAQGVVVYYYPDKVFDPGTFNGRQVKIPRNDGTDDADLLLAAETVTAICIDGADNKWFGTLSGGAYYTSADGVEEIHHFSTDNSPLPNNNVLAMAIAPESGEVFIATSNGIISYRGEATEGEETYDKIFAFPNPVKSDYYGPITIKGLIAGSIVKITDIAGHVVYEAHSTGGQLVWDGRNLNGDRVATGVYLVLASTEIGEQKSTTKILFIK